MPPREWFIAKTQAATLFGERFIKVMAAQGVTLPDPSGIT